MSRASRELQLTSRSGVATDAAALSLNAGRDDAVALLERGRAVLWGQQLETRTDLQLLAATDADLAGRLDEIRRQLR